MVYKRGEHGIQDVAWVTEIAIFTLEIQVRDSTCESSVARSNELSPKFSLNEAMRAALVIASM